MVLLLEGASNGCENSSAAEVRVYQLTLGAAESARSTNREILKSFVSGQLVTKYADAPCQELRENCTGKYHCLQNSAKLGTSANTCRSVVQTTSHSNLVLSQFASVHTVFGHVPGACAVVSRRETRTRRKYRKFRACAQLEVWTRGRMRCEPRF